jgi:pimeloyl-ACP methyl ester carboxylesterase
VSARRLSLAAAAVAAVAVGFAVSGLASGAELSPTATVCIKPNGQLRAVTAANPVCVARKKQPSPIAGIYASSYPASGVVSVDAPVRFEPFAEQLRTLRPQLEGEGFDRAWEFFRESMRLDLLDDAQRAYLSERPSRELFLSYQADLLERPLEEAIRWRDDGLNRVRRSRIPYVALHTKPVDPEERAFVAERLPQAEVLYWPIEHHFPHVAEPERFARLLMAM